MRRLLLLISISFLGCGDAPRSLEERLNAQPGFWFEARPGEEGAGRMRTLAELGYVEGYVPAREEFGARVHDPARVQPGCNLYSSGHAPEAYLTTLEGELLHTWSLPYADVPGGPPMEHSSQAAWRRVRLLAGGRLLAIYEGLALVCVDRDSRLLWAFAGNAHHDLDVGPDGRIHVLTRRTRIHEKLNPRTAILEDFVAVLSPEGELVQEVSVYDALVRSSWAGDLTRAAAEGGDVVHTNSIQLLDGSQADRNPAFAAGNVLVGLRELDAAAVIDLRRRKVVWLARGGWRAPHDPRLVADGGLLIFDNMGNAGYSRVVEIDVSTRETRWTFQGGRPEDFFSVFCGTASRLENGNTLITESCNGRALEVTTGGAVVWSFLSPHRAGPDGELVAALFEVVRLPPGVGAGWLETGVKSGARRGR